MEECEYCRKIDDGTKWLSSITQYHYGKQDVLESKELFNFLITLKDQHLKLHPFHTGIEWDD